MDVFSDNHQHTTVLNLPDWEQQLKVEIEGSSDSATVTLCPFERDERIPAYVAANGCTLTEPEFEALVSGVRTLFKQARKAKAMFEHDHTPAIQAAE